MVRNPGRLAAPIAIAVVAVGTYFIVQSNLGSHHAAAARTTAAHPRRGRTHASARRRRRAVYYTVRSGDTMSDIARRSGVALARLEALNASLAPAYELHTGQRLRLRR